MKIKSISIKEAMSLIAENKIFLPPIQRSFIWDRDRITGLFDSLYRDYPIGNCIFWKLQPSTSKSYPLYKFLSNYSENKSSKKQNELAPKNILDTDVLAVVDGQQRLSSLFICLAGTYRYKKSGKKVKNADASSYISKVHINLFQEDQGEFGENFFHFLTTEDAKSLTEQSLWFELGQILSWASAKSAKEYMDGPMSEFVAQAGKKSLSNKFEKKKAEILVKIQAIYRMLNEERLHYFEIDNQNLDEVVDIFTRINSGGMVLKKSDLLFSILVSQWLEARDEVKEIVEYMKYRGIDISQDFVMRCCLVLSDLPIKYNLNSFKKSNISKIKKNWPEIRNSLEEMCDLFEEIGYAGQSTVSDNALIPIAYYIMKGGNTESSHAKHALQRYFAVSQVNGMFSGQSDEVLEKVRSEIKRQLTTKKILNYSKLVELRLPGNKSIKLTSEKLEQMVEETAYGTPEAYFLLSLIYPTVNHMNKTYEMDHIHPKSKFNVANLRKNGVEDEKKIEEWMDEKRDLLPNLQLLTKEINLLKRSKPLLVFLSEQSAKEQKQFLEENLLPPRSQLKLEDFDEFFEFRKKALLTKLKKRLVI